MRRAAAARPLPPPGATPLAPSFCLRPVPCLPPGLGLLTSAVEAYMLFYPGAPKTLGASGGGGLRWVLRSLGPA